MWLFGKKETLSPLKQFIQNVCEARKADYNIVTKNEDKLMGIAESLVYNILCSSNMFVQDLFKDAKEIGKLTESVDNYKADDMIIETAIWTYSVLTSYREAETKKIQDEYEKLGKEWNDNLYDSLTISRSLMGAVVSNYFNKSSDEMADLIKARKMVYFLAETMQKDKFGVAKAESNLICSAKFGLFEPRTATNTITLNFGIGTLIPISINLYESHMSPAIYQVAKNLCKHTFPKDNK